MVQQLCYKDVSVLVTAKSLRCLGDAPETYSVLIAFHCTCLHLHLAIHPVEVVFLQSIWAVPDVMERLPDTMEKALLNKSADTVMYLIDVLR